MTAWAGYVASGVAGDGIEYRLVIEGCALEFCTHEAMAGALVSAGQDGKRRVGGLKREGLGFSEQCYLAGAEMSAGVNAARVMETPYPYLDAASSVFTALPQVKCYLTATLEAADVTMTVDSTAALTVGDYLHVSTEVVQVTSLPGAGVVGIERASWNTTAQRHTVTTSGGAPAVRPLRDGVRVWSGRRTWLYAHGAAELATSSNGTLVCRGKLASEPKLDADGIMWSLPMDSRWSLLDQEIGAGLDKPRALRGAYYPGSAPFIALWHTSNTGTRGGPYTTAGLTASRVVLTGHYETNAEFCEALVDALNTTSSLFEFSYRETPGGQWDLLVTIPATARYLEMFGGSPVDGWFNMGLVPLEPSSDLAATGRNPPIGTVVGNETYIVSWSDTPAFGGFIGGAPPPIPIEDMRRIPRSINSPVDYARGTAAEIASHPTSRCYLDDVAGIGVGDTLIIAQTTTSGAEAPPRLCEVASVDTSTSSVTAADGRSLAFVSSGTAGAIDIKASKALGDPAGCTLADFRDALVADAPDGANDATAPWVLDDDLASWADAVGTAVEALGDYAARRIYTYHQGVRASDVIKHELRAHGLFPYLDADFKIAVRPLTIDTAAVPLDRYLDADDGSILTRDSFGELQSGEDGNVNTVEIARGYDPIEDKHKGAPITVVTVEGVSEAKKRRILEISPKATPAGLELDAASAQRLSDPVRALFGGQILQYTVQVPITAWPILVGDSVVVSVPQLPYGGARAVHDPGAGLVQRTMVVTGREWDLEDGIGKLTGLVTGLNVAGYTPTARVTGQTGATTSWTVTCEAQRYSPTGAVDVAYFAVGDKVRVVQWDAASPTTKSGTVTAVDTALYKLSITFSSSWTPGSSTWIVSYDTSDVVADAQLARAFCASTVRRIDDGGAGLTAKVFAP